MGIQYKPLLEYADSFNCSLFTFTKLFTSGNTPIRLLFCCDINVFFFPYLVVAVSFIAIISSLFCFRFFADNLFEKTPIMLITTLSSLSLYIYIYITTLYFLLYTWL